MPIVLVANRAEIALRVFRTARRLGYGCVAVYSDADADAPHVRAADKAVRIGPAPATDSYLRADRIVDAALQTSATLVHPGYGFLAEDAAFGECCQAAGVGFVGPQPAVLRLMGDKAAAKRAAAAAGVPVFPSADPGAAADIGFPVVLKPVAGGGGKGMTVVRDPGDLARAVDAARRIAGAAFGDDRLMVERYVEGARHVEVQVVGDAFGTVVHLFERDCSVQRRHQKVLEESPSPALDPATRRDLCDAAVRLARHSGYTSAGTVEFLVAPDGTFGFIEMNARLQVEHPVTELVCGVDLVELQLRVALGEPLGLSQEAVRVSGHAVEARVYAEDPAHDFLPQSGRVLHVRWPPGLRVDTWVDEGGAVTTHYDPLLAKLVAHGADRDSALEALRSGLAAAEVLGVRTNLGFLSRLLDDPDVRGGSARTDLIDRITSFAEPQPSDVAFAVAAAAEACRVAERRDDDPWGSLPGWRAGGARRTTVVLRAGDQERACAVSGTGPWSVGDLEVSRRAGCHDWRAGDARVAAAYDAGTWHVWDGAASEIAVGPRPRSAGEAETAHLGSPMPGTVVAVRAAAGDRVSRGQELVVVEAMKMEHPVRAPADGVVRVVLCEVGDRVDRGQRLVEVDPA